MNLKIFFQVFNVNSEVIYNPATNSLNKSSKFVYNLNLKNYKFFKRW